MSDDWRAREQAVNEALAKLAPGVATELSVLTESRWEAEVVKPTEAIYASWNVLLHGPGRAKLRLSKGDTGEVMTRVRIVALYPTKASHYWYRDVTTSISVGAGRGADATAREIARRLLPDYLPSLAEAHRRIAEFDADNARRVTRRDRIREVAGLPDATSLVSHQQSETRSTIYLNLPGGQHGTVEMWGDGSSTKVELSSVPYETALAIVHLLGRINSRPRAVA